jgi:outer membrane protein TolC
VRPALVLFLGWVGAPAAYASPLTLAEVRALAREADLVAMAADARAQTARREARVAALGLLPALTVRGSAGGVDGATISQVGEFDTARFGIADPSASVGWSIDPIASALDARAEGRMADSFEARADAAALAAERAAVTRYFALLGAESRALVAAQSVRDTRDLLGVADARVSGGTARGEELARAQAEAAAADAILADTELARTQAAIALAVILGLDPTAELSADPGELRPGSIETEGLLQRALAQRPEIAAADAAVRAGRRRVGAAVGDLLSPELWVTASHGALGPDYGALAQRRVWSAGASWTLSASGLGSVGVQRGRVAEAAVASAAVELSIRADAANALASFEAAERRAAATATAASAAEQAWLSVIARYDGGTANIVEVIDARRTLERARLADTDARVQAAWARTELTLVAPSP